MQVTIQTKIAPEANLEFLEDTGAYIGRLRARLLKALLAGEKINDLKKRYVEEYKITARQFNSLASEVTGLIKSAKELRQRNLTEAKARRTALKKTIKKLREKLKKAGPAQRERKKTAKENLRYQIHQKSRKLARIEAKIARLEKQKLSICLGGKKLFRAQFNLEANGYKTHEEWKQAWRKARGNRIYYIGSKDEKFGNQNCQLIAWRLQIRVAPALQEKFGNYVDIPVQFNYRVQIIMEALANGQAINYRFVRKAKGWYIHVTTEKAAMERVTRRDCGAIGVDLNKAHLAWAETNRHGNLIHSGTIATPIQDRRADQVTATLSEAVKQIVEYARKQEKPIVIEDLDFSGKKTTFDEKHTGYRRMLSYFAYAKFRDLIHSRAARSGVEIIVKTPAFSSIIGKFKYAMMYGISVHIAASLVLARRGQRFSERPPAKNALCLAEHRHRHVWGLWRLFVKAVSNREIRVDPRSWRGTSSGLSPPG